MQQEPDRPDRDWPAAFDDAFVQAAPVREAPAAVRAAQARRIAQDHGRRDPWRGPTTTGAGGRRRDRHRLPTAVAVVAAVLTIAVLLDLSGWVSGTRLDARTAATGVPLLPRPDDAQDTRLLPAAVPPPGTGGYDVLTEDRGRAVGFDPCRPVHWAMRPDGAPPDGLGLVSDAFSQLSAATGLVFTYDGPTSEAPAADRAAVQDRYGERYAPVLVAWSDERESPGLAGRVGGHAGPLPADPDFRGLRYLTGQVVLDVATFAALPAGNPTRATIVLHELGHVVGLDHVADEADTMHEASGGVAGYTPGALRGLAAVGAGPCF